MQVSDWCNLAVSIASAYAAFSSAKSAKESNKAARESLSMQYNIEKQRLDEAAAAQKQSSMQRILDQLTYDARRANSFDVVDRPVETWNQDSTANIIYSLDAAISKIQKWTEVHGNDDEIYLSVFFLDQINHRIIKTLGRDSMPKNLPNDREFSILWFNVVIFLRKHKAAH